MAEIGNRKERLRVREAGASAAGRGQRPYASFPGFLPLNPLRTPSPPLKRAGTPCTRERGLRPGLTALRGASGGWVTGFEPAHITAFAGAKTLVENEKGWFDHPFFFYRMCRTQPAVAIENKPTVAMHPCVATETQPAVAMHLSVATETQPTVAMHPRVAIGKQPAVAIGKQPAVAIPCFLQKKTKTA